MLMVAEVFISPNRKEICILLCHDAFQRDGCMTSPLWWPGISLLVLDVSPSILEPRGLKFLCFVPSWHAGTADVASRPLYLLGLGVV